MQISEQGSPQYKRRFHPGVTLFILISLLPANEESVLFTIFDVLLIAGIIQGTIAIPILLLRRQHRVSNCLLALSILTFCLLFIKILMLFTGTAAHSRTAYLPNNFELASAPLLYFYLRALTENNFIWRWQYLVHFVPFALAFSYGLLIYMAIPSSLNADAISTVLGQYAYDQVKETEDWAIVVSIFCYLCGGTKKYMAFQQSVLASTADSAYPTLHWLRIILVLFIGLWVFLLVNMTISRVPSWTPAGNLHWQIYFVSFAAITWCLAFMAFRQQGPDLTQLTTEHPEENIRDDTTTLNNDEQEYIQTIIRLLEEEKLFRQPDLNAVQMAGALNISTGTLSRVINRHFKKPFRELINDYRINDVKTSLLQNEKGTSVLSIALDSGFNSEASFYRVFRQKTGMTPTEFIADSQK